MGFYFSHTLEQWLLVSREFAFPRGLLAMSGALFGCCAWDRECYCQTAGIRSVKHPVMHRTAPQQSTVSSTKCQ